MARHVFFLFHHERDHWRANRIRETWEGEDRMATGFVEMTEWEGLKQEGAAAVRRWVDDQLKGTSVTAVLIGAETANERWINYAIEESAAHENGLVGIRIHNMGDEYGLTDPAGENPFDVWYYSQDGKQWFTDVWKTYDWHTHNGPTNLEAWVEEAAEIAKQRQLRS